MRTLIPRGKVVLGGKAGLDGRKAGNEEDQKDPLQRRSLEPVRTSAVPPWREDAEAEAKRSIRRV